MSDRECVFAAYEPVFRGHLNLGEEVENGYSCCLQVLEPWLPTSRPPRSAVYQVAFSGRPSVVACSLLDPASSHVAVGI